jgi:hypothetical protein
MSEELGTGMGNATVIKGDPVEEVPVVNAIIQTRKVKPEDLPVENASVLVKEPEAPEPAPDEPKKKKG